MNRFVTDLVALLRRHPAVRSVRVVTLDETPSGRLEVKIRCQLAGGYQFQVWLHRELHALDYAYQLFTQKPLLRWDNAPHYPRIPTAPHHFHDVDGEVGSSTLTGDPLVDLPVVLRETQAWIERHLS